ASKLVFTGGASMRSFDTSIPTPASWGHRVPAGSRRHVAQKIPAYPFGWPTELLETVRPRKLTSALLQSHRDRLQSAMVCSVQRGILRPDFLGMPIRLREFVDCHLETANDHRGHTKALRLLGHIVEHVLECSDVGSISHMLLRTISH